MVPESNYLIERVFELKGEENEVFDSQDRPLFDMESFFRRASEFNLSDYSLKEEGIKYVLEGLLPYIYKYVNAVLNLTNFGSIKKHIKFEKLLKMKKTDSRKYLTVL